jgi:hypothetical protein
VAFNAATNPRLGAAYSFADLQSTMSNQRWASRALLSFRQCLLYPSTAQSAGFGCTLRPALPSAAGSYLVARCVFITAGPSTKLFTWGGGGDSGGHVLRETTSRGLCGLVCPSRTSERGGEGDCVKEGGGEEGKCERERALERLRYYGPRH